MESQEVMSKSKKSQSRNTIMLLRDKEVTKGVCPSVKGDCLNLGRLHYVGLGKEWGTGRKLPFLYRSTCTYHFNNHKTKFKTIAAQEQKVLKFLAMFVNKCKSHVHIT